MKNNQTVLLIFLFFLPSLLLAQVSIKGYVGDKEGNPLPGASVIVKGTPLGTSTDFEGNFELDITNNAKILEISYLGFLKKDVPLTGKANYVIILESDANTLEEIVVTGYGSVRRKDLASASQTVRMDDAEEIFSQYQTVSSILQGRVSGVDVSSNTGTPGGAVSVRIRGTNSLRGNNEPLYVVDGVIMGGADEDVLDATNDGNETQVLQNGLTGINPRDIENIEVLKDAAATALYGSRGANGVVLITTKRGKLGDANIEVFTSSTISNVNKKIPVLNAVEYAQYINEAQLIREFSPTYQVNGTDVYKFSEDGVLDPTPLQQVNWQDEIYEQGYSYNYGATISGATEKSRYYFSGDFNEIQGTTPGNFLNNANFRSNFSTNVTDRLKVDFRLGLYMGRGNMAQAGSKADASRSLTRNLTKYSPLLEENEGEVDDDEPQNPYSFIEGYEDKSNEKRVNAGLNLEYKLSDAFSYQLRAGINYRNKDRSRWYGPEITKGANANGVLALSGLNRTAYTIDNLINFNKNFNKKHRLNATAGITYDGSDAIYSTYEVTQFPINELRENSPQLGELVTSPYAELGAKETILSYLARVNYIFNNKYVFSGTYRIDQSSKFKGDNKTGYFPSFSFAWRASKENFLVESNVISDLKLRASWGQVGNQAIKPYQTYSNFGGMFYVDFNDANILGVAPINLANPDITWETTEQLNLGVDMGFWDQRLSATVDVYTKETKDLLLELPSPTSTGFQKTLVNQGGIENKGIEFSIEGLIVDKEDFSISLGANMSINKPEIIGLGELPKGDIYVYGELVEDVAFYFGDNVSSGGYKQPANAFIEGQPIGTFYGYTTNGIYQNDTQAASGPLFSGLTPEEGDVIYVDLNDDGVINDSDRGVIGNPNPDFVYGINLHVNYKKFDLAMFFNGSQGNEILNGNLMTETYTKGTTNSNVRPEAYYDAWSVNNRTGTYPRLLSESAQGVTSDRLIEDGSFFRLSNLTLGYDITINENFIKNVKLFSSVNNLFTITDYSGYDPSPSSFRGNGNLIGVDWVGTPNLTSFVLGVNIKF